MLSAHSVTAPVSVSDLISLLQSVSKGDAAAQRLSYTNKSLTDYSPVTLALLVLCCRPALIAKVSE